MIANEVFIISVACFHFAIKPLAISSFCIRETCINKSESVLIIFLDNKKELEQETAKATVNLGKRYIRRLGQLCEKESEERCVIEKGDVGWENIGVTLEKEKGWRERGGARI